MFRHLFRQSALSNQKRIILITSATSGVGLAVIDSLQGRRKSLRIIGVSTDLSGQFPHEFDFFLQSPPTDSKDYAEFIEEICVKWNVDLVLTGRDDDLIALGQLHDNPNSPVIMQRSSMKMSSFRQQIQRCTLERLLLAGLMAYV